MDYSTLFKILLLISLGGSVWTALVWNTKGEAALFISIAVPIAVPNPHVFLSYNFEASYALPPTWRKKPPIFHRGNGTHLDNEVFHDFEDYYEDNEGHKHHHKHKKPKPPKRKKPKPLHHHKPQKPSKNKHKHKPKPKPIVEDYKDFFEGFPRNKQDVAKAKQHQANSLLSRTKFYEILRHKFEIHGFGNSDHCLLRLICEANSAQLGELNGILGSLMHVMFSPSSSSSEALPERYYTAESNGQRNNCTEYYAKCKRSVLDLITRPLADYIGNKTII